MAMAMAMAMGVVSHELTVVGMEPSLSREAADALYRKICRETDKHLTKEEEAFLDILRQSKAVNLLLRMGKKP